MSLTAKRTLVIRLTQHGVHVNNHLTFPWDQTNWPPADSFQINPRLDIYWLCEMCSFDQEAGILELTVLDYHASEKIRFSSQHMKKPVHQLRFVALKAREVKEVLQMYDEQIDQICEAESIKRTPSDYSDLSYGESLAPAHAPQVKTSITVAWADLCIRQGCITTVYTPKGFSNAMEVVVYNPNLLAPFENIKPFFKRHIGKSRLKLDIVFEIQDGIPRFLHASSRELEAIDTACIQAVKTFQFNQLQRAAPKTRIIDKSLFTADELFTEMDDALKGNVFQLSAMEILEQLLDLKPSRNRKQIEYLANNCQDQDAPMLFNLQPQFGFLFRYTGAQQVHYIWELLNSHATYLWSYTSGNELLKDHLTHVQQQVQLVKLQGRNVYKSTASEDQPFGFQVLPHGTSSASVTDAFPVWKHRLLSLLI